MSSHIEALAVADIYSKWELAQRMSDHTKAPEQALKSAFDLAMQQLEIVAHAKFENSIKERILETISGQILKDIRETFMLEFCDHVLKSFSDEEATKMLKEHKKTGVVKKISDTELFTGSQLIQIAYEVYNLYQSSIIDVVAKKALSMTDQLMPALVAAVEIKRIELPEPTKKATLMSFRSITESAVPTAFEMSLFAALTDGVETEDLDKVREALQNGANPNGYIGVESIVHRACVTGNIDIVRELLNNRAELNNRSLRGDYTPLHRACWHGHTAVVAELIIRGAQVNIRTSDGWKTPLENAITAEQFECCQLLVQAGAEVNGANREGITHLANACYIGNYKIVKLLLDSGANPNLSTAYGTTPLYLTVHSSAILQLMLDSGAKVNAQNAPGFYPRAYPIPAAASERFRYPIHAAASGGFYDSVSALLKAGADTKVRDGRNITPVELARWQLNNLRTNPCNPALDDAKMIERLEKVIGLLEDYAQ